MSSNFVYSLNPTGIFMANNIVLGDLSSKTYILIDCGGDITPAMNFVRSKGLQTCTEIVCTHGHIDHVAGLQQAVNITRAPISIHTEDRQLYNIAPVQGMLFGIQLQPLPPPTRLLEDQDRIYVGNYEGVVKHTPGHSPGSICIEFEELGILITGDTLFSGTVGNTTLPGGDPAKLKMSVLSILNNTPENTVVMPGHGGLTSIKREKQTNTIYYM
ncbi:beta lactamase domain, putative [Entamoeba invadens IP1]|uniref:Beta lactamase domain, putative n=1 Tax=Entamoeba invadens IP1 TaxID=370355 RepID=A0A0A1U9V3_ENTIV|nr:beta lactamase domain, putative [Entamoeba invadens IP1]ELP88905.1 beta lactamase domain, putative [Entamoeba invadens IP1]|eukprot:XP_004255676.1 beta lactamase domain, putative [Entamoeba invadens IP1]